MRIFFIILSAATVISILYKWRYRVMNMILAVSFLRKMAVSLSMNLPEIKEKAVSGLFNAPPPKDA